MKGAERWQFLGRDVGGARGFASRKGSKAFSITRELRLGVFIARLGLLLDRADALLQTFQVGQHQLGLDRIGIGEWIDAVLDVGDVVILEAAQNVSDRVDLADVRQELVAQALALRRATHQPGDVNERKRVGMIALRPCNRRQRCQARVGHADFADVRLDGAEGIVGCLGRRGLRSAR